VILLYRWCGCKTRALAHRAGQSARESSMKIPIPCCTKLSKSAVYMMGAAVYGLNDLFIGRFLRNIDDGRADYNVS
jgi:hypothetical protein